MYRTLERKNLLLEEMQASQMQFITKDKPTEIFNCLLNSLLKLTDSDYGFIDEVQYDKNGKFTLIARAITNIAWNDKSNELYQKFLNGTLGFDRFDSMYGQIVLTGKPYIANDAPNDVNRINNGMPEGHPPLNKFLGLPLFKNKEFVGMIGLANRKEDYTDQIVDYLQPMLSLCATYIASWKLEQELQESEKKFQQLADAMPQMVWAADHEGFVNYYNQRWYHLTGMQNNGTYGDESWKSVVHPDDFQRCYDTWYSCVSTETILDMEIRFWIPSLNEYRWYLCKALPIKEKNRPVKWIGTCTDIHYQKTVEEQLRKLIHANHELENFAMIAAHDLQDPLKQNSVFTKLIKSGRVEFISELENNNSRMQEFIKNLLTFARSGGTDLKFIQTDLNITLNDVIKDLASIIIESKVNIIVSPMPIIKCDSIQIRRVFQNLIKNSIKYSKHNTKTTIEINAIKNKTHWVFSVIDNGIGIPKEQIPILFTIYGKKTAGTGFGLASCKRIIEGHQGTFEVKSEVGIGSTFNFSIKDNL